MSHIFTRIRHSYGDMKLESKFTLVLLLTATVPVIMMACFFYGKLYDMVVSYTIRQEQDTVRPDSSLHRRSCTADH